MLKIGITGGMGSGKSIISKIFMCLQIPVYNADNEAKKIMIKDENLITRIKNIFGQEAYFPDGELNRTLISQQAFNNAALLEQLNAIVHPAVYQHFENWCKTQQSPYLIKEAALLFESKSYLQCDAVILVSAPEDLRIARVMRRDTLNYAQIKARMDKQMLESEKMKLTDIHIINDEKEAVLPQIFELHQQFLKGIVSC